ncbi:pre-peptidase C-terminal domain-containing protein [Plectonema cf. radiosum LEGE 06105]|uniref:Pre-peptidase C-terminal domain-containing protein n=1 Tax=Plectonema cf. radiosum LEGE 06105 TaxID=945769 RepID=A0A8J7F5T8_9CYAN|nr:pre-peptidase C-terminal domain-containing protein [Plectonema radiosum]MBE9215028.1 pre-peptidase C-terminal domain-containing protein [Plectonema cf. radiosum LEGE 06105]
MTISLVSLNTGPDLLVESEGTVSAHVFNITNGTIPAEGLVVSVSAPNLSEFDLDAINVSEGGEIVAVRSDGFDIRLTDFTVFVDLPIANDGETEGLETTSFSLVAGEGYEVNSAFSSGEFRLVDTRAEVPNSTVSETNDTIPLAANTGISSENPSFFTSSSLDFEIGNRYQNEDGSFSYVDATEDVDLYKVVLEAGNTIKIDVDSMQLDFMTPYVLDSGLRVFDASGNELAFNDDAPASGEIFFSEFDPYIEFTAETDGTYYVGLSVWDNWQYDTSVPGSGSAYTDNVYGGGDYELTIDLVQAGSDDNGSDGNSENGGETLAPAEDVTISLQTITAAFDEDDNLLASALVESLESGGSVLTLVVSAQGEIPEDGVEVIINSDIDLTEYIGDLRFPPFSPGGEVLEAVYDESGVGTGLKFRLDEPYAIINLPVLDDEEADGPQEATFFLEPSAGYIVNEETNASTVTFYDTLEDVPELPTVPQVGISVSETNLIESEGTATTLTFSLNEAPPEEGVLIYLSSGVPGSLSEFDVLNAEISGGVFPSANFQSSGFYFRITEPTATITVSAFDETSLPDFDPESALEGIEEFTYTLQPGIGYTINPTASSFDITIADNPDSIALPDDDDDDDNDDDTDTEVSSEPNDTISTAIATGLSGEQTSYSTTAAISYDQDLNPVDASEDVDFYTFDLQAGDTVTIDIDSIEYFIEEFDVPQQLDSELRLFDAQGNELASVENAAAPGEELSRDPYLEFTASEAGTYYVGVSQLGNRNYDSNVEGSGSGWIFPKIGVNAGAYDLNISLTPGNVPEQPTTQPVFGSLEQDIIEVEGSNGLIFAGNSDDLIDASISSSGNNRIYAGSGNDTVILGSGDRLIGGAGDDKFFALSGGDNIITGGAGADQFWIATAEIPQAANIITDFTLAEDVLGIAGLGIGFDDLSITGQDDNTLIAVNGSDLAILQGIGAASLNADNFAFA